MLDDSPVSAQAQALLLEPDETWASKLVLRVRQAPNGSILYAESARTAFPFAAPLPCAPQDGSPLAALSPCEVVSPDVWSPDEWSPVASSPVCFRARRRMGGGRWPRRLWPRRRTRFRPRSPCMARFRPCGRRVARFRSYRRPFFRTCRRYSMVFFGSVRLRPALRTRCCRQVLRRRPLVRWPAVRL